MGLICYKAAMQKGPEGPSDLALVSFIYKVF